MTSPSRPRWWSSGAAALRRSGPPRMSRAAWAADIALGLVLTGGALYYAVSAGTGPFDAALPGVPPAVTGHSPWAVLLALLTGLPLALRRRYPLTVFWVVVLSTVLFQQQLRNHDAAAFTLAACLVAAYSAAVYSPHRGRMLASLVVGAALVFVKHDSTFPNLPARYVPFLLALGIGVAANTANTWRRRIREIEAEQQAATERAVAQERARIARELHDVVTHNVAVMVVQAGAARQVLVADPDRAREALLAVEASGRAAMAELRHTMGLLTPVDGPAALVPQPGLGQLQALLERVRETGVPVDYAATGTAVPLPPGPDLALYRVVQEALTNAVKHAAGARVRVAIGYLAADVCVEITDSGGTAGPAVRDGNGRGLAGLRDRLDLYGGTLQAGPRPTGGWRVAASIPVPQP